jgi:RNA polymerase sigma-70 factor, ECF subfamily
MLRSAVLLDLHRRNRAALGGGITGLCVHDLTGRPVSSSACLNKPLDCWSPVRWNIRRAGRIPVDEMDQSRAQRFGELIVPHLTALYCTALRLTGKTQDAEDLVQETCLRAFRALDQLREPAAAKVWVFRVLRSVFLRCAEREVPRTTISVDDPDTVAWAALEFSRPDDTSLRDAVLEDVRDAVVSLPLVHREPILLAHVAGFSYREMAEILEVPLGTVMSRLFRARRLLRQMLAETTRGHLGSESWR